MKNYFAGMVVFLVLFTSVLFIVSTINLYTTEFDFGYESAVVDCMEKNLKCQLTYEKIQNTVKLEELKNK